MPALNPSPTSSSVLSPKGITWHRLGRFPQLLARLALPEKHLLQVEHPPLHRKKNCSSVSLLSPLFFIFFTIAYAHSHYLALVYSFQKWKNKIIVRHQPMLVVPKRLFRACCRCRPMPILPRGFFPTRRRRHGLHGVRRGPVRSLRRREGVQRLHGLPRRRPLRHSRRRKLHAVCRRRLLVRGGRRRVQRLRGLP